MKNSARRISKVQSQKAGRNPYGNLFLGTKVISELRILARLASPKRERLEVPERRAA
jgi:hypothetical protein